MATTSRTEQEFQELKKKAETAVRAYDQAQGALQQLMKRLQKEHGCSSVEEAEVLLRQLERKAEKNETRLQQVLDTFREQWSEQLES